MKTFLILNTQSAGDAFVGTHLARLIKEDHPDSYIVFAIRAELTLTTRENDPNAIGEVLDIIEAQYGIDSVGIVHNGLLQVKGYCPQSFDQEILQSEWNSDYGIVGSQLLPYYDKIPLKLNTETKFQCGSEKKLPYKPSIAIACFMDWNRKWQNDLEIGKLYLYLEHQRKEGRFDISFYGRDASFKTYKEQLQNLNNCHLLVSPIGSLVHLATGLGVDTISLTSVFPREYDAPEFYHSGYHKSIKCLPKFHCGDYKCVTYKSYDPTSHGWGNPSVSLGTFWPKECPYTKNKKSCVVNITADDIIKEIEAWLDNKNSKIQKSISS